VLQVRTILSRRIRGRPVHDSGAEKKRKKGGAESVRKETEICLNKEASFE